MKVQGLKKLLNDLDKIKKKYEKASPVVVVGYSQRYAVYVHENLDASHKRGKQAKFLESPARSMQPQLAKTIAEEMKKSGNLEKALLKAGFQLQRASQKIVPVATGALKASAFTALQKDAEQKAISAWKKGFRKANKEKWNDEWHTSE